MDHTQNPASRRDVRKRSRSPYKDESSARDVKRHRSRSPHYRRRHHRTGTTVALPFRSKALHKHDFEAYRPLFADYLDLQKQLDIHSLDDHELKGRWKSFVGKWNRRELAEGWYDPETKSKAEERFAEQSRMPRAEPGRKSKHEAEGSASDEDEDDIGPAMPNSKGGRRPGPAVPSFQDLQHKRELAEEDREAQIADLRYDRKQDRKLQKDRLEELAPRAETGSRERQLEKKREAAASNKAFAETKEAGAEDVGENDLMGDDGIDGYKAKKKQMEKQKNERELRKEETLRARAVERGGEIGGA